MRKVTMIGACNSSGSRLKAERPHAVDQERQF